jgi:hypothetical protein
VKAILEFNLPEDQESYDTVNKAVDFRLAIEDMMRELRDKIKYSELSKTEKDFAEKLQKEYFQILIDRGIEDLV